jgi:hypothetical protein
MQDLILYHDPGAGGDFLTSLLQNTGLFYAARDFDGVDAMGRVTPGSIIPEVQTLFPHHHNSWKERDWSDWDEAKIKSCTDKVWVLNVMRPRGIKELRDKGCDWPILRISYERNMYWFIKKCVLKKLMRKPYWIRSNNAVDNYMLEKGKLAPWMLKKHLKDPKNVYLLLKRANEKFWRKNPPKWDISVDSLLVKDYSEIKELAADKFDQQSIDFWVNAQQPMFTKRPKLPQQVEKLFGYNSCLDPTDYPCPLDELDNIVIKFYYPDAPTFNNTQELFTYF